MSSFPYQPRWNLWRYLDPKPDGKRPKKPYDLNQVPGLTSASRLGTREEVNRMWNVAPGAFHGRGYAPSIDCPYAGLDFDDLTLPKPLLMWNDLMAHTYCERSPSGLLTKGHAIITLNRAAKERLKGIRNLMPGIELYSDSGWFTVTENALNALDPTDYSDEFVNLADKLNLHPADTTTVPILVTGREVTQKEIGRVIEKISQWVTAKQFLDMKDGPWPPMWAQLGRHGGPDRSFLMVHFVSMLVNAGARDPDLLWAIIAPSAVWAAYKGKWPKKPGYAEKMLWDDIVAKKLAATSEPQKGGGKPFTLPNVEEK